MISSGQKPEEYREIKDYWARRLITSKEEMEWAVFEELVNDLKNPFLRHNGVEDLLKYFGAEFKHFDTVRFRNGYKKYSPVFTIPLQNITVDVGNDKWGADAGVYYFVLKLGNQ